MRCNEVSALRIMKLSCGQMKFVFDETEFCSCRAKTCSAAQWAAWSGDRRIEYLVASPHRRPADHWSALHSELRIPNSEFFLTTHYSLLRSSASLLGPRNLALGPQKVSKYILFYSKSIIINIDFFIVML